MPNRNHNDKARENFNSRHSCSEKKDKSKVCTKDRCSTSYHCTHTPSLFLHTGRLLGVQGLAQGLPIGWQKEQRMRVRLQ
jgi:hypothetical protein